jgi:hypothetical protein
MKQLVVFCIIMLLVGCNKPVKENKALAGEWKAVSLKVTDSDGFSTYPTTDLRLTFQSTEKKYTELHCNCNRNNNR